MKKPNFVFWALVFLFTISTTFGQHQENKEANEQGHETFKRGRIAPVFAYSWIPKADHHSGDLSGVIVAPTIGFDLEYFIKERWAIGLYADVEIMVYEVDQGDGDFITREYPVVLALGTAYEFAKSWNIFGAVGYEFEHHESFFIGEFGISREIRIPNNWDISPGFTYTIKEGYDSWKLGVAFGKRF